MILPLGDEQIAHGFDKGRAHHQAGVWRYEATGARIAQSGPPIVAFLLQCNFISILPDIASIWRKLAWQVG
jgi:hypothetical protein